MPTNKTTNKNTNKTTTNKEELLDKFRIYLEKTKKPYISNIAEDLGITELEVLGLVSCLGLKTDKNKVLKVVETKNPDIYTLENDLSHVRLLLISDTHLGSKYDRLDILRYLYEKADSTNTNYILHSGDMTEGVSGRPEQLYELRGPSYTEQRDYVIEEYPRSSGYPHSFIPTYFIAGNHDKWWIKRCGSDICKDISDRRVDLTYLGSDCEDLEIGSLRIRMYHGKGGTAYARSYKLQKYLDSIPPRELPHILQTGHVHNAFYMKQGDTHCFQTGCLEDLTPYARSQGFTSEKSCWWVDVYFDDKGYPHRISQELETFESKKVRKCP